MPKPPPTSGHETRMRSTGTPNTFLANCDRSECTPAPENCRWKPRSSWLPIAPRGSRAETTMRLYDYGPSQNCFKVRLFAAQLNIVAFGRAGLVA